MSNDEEKKISTYRTKLSYEHVKLIDNFEDTKFQNSNRMNNCSLSYTVLLARVHKYQSKKQQSVVNFR